MCCGVHLEIRGEPVRFSFFFSPAMWVLGIELKLPGLAVSTFAPELPCWPRCSFAVYLHILWPFHSFYPIFLEKDTKNYLKNFLCLIMCMCVCQCVGIYMCEKVPVTRSLDPLELELECGSLDMAVGD